MTARLPRELACRELVRIVTDYLEGALTVDERTRFEQHLVFCKGCSVYLRQMRDTLRATGRLTEKSVSDEAREELLWAFRAFRKAER
jgi:putative zinc finger protein